MRRKTPAPKQKRERCYLIPSKDGKTNIRVRAQRKPDRKTIEALQDLFDAAYRHLSDIGH